MKKRICCFLLIAALCGILLSGCVSKSSYCVKYGDHSISAGMYAYQLQIQKSNYLSQNSLTESEEIWNEEYDDEMTIGEYVQTVTLQTLVSSLVWRTQFDELGLSFTDKEQADIDKKIEEMVTSSGGMDTLKAELKEYGISYDEYIESVFYDSLKILKVVDYYYGEKGLEPVPDKEIMAYFKDNYARCKHIFLSTLDSDGVTMDDDSLAKVKAKAETVFAEAKGADDKTFEALIKKYNEDEGVASNPDGYLFTTGEMDGPFETAAFDMDIGETRLVKGTYGYHIIRKLTLEDKSVYTEQVRQNMLTKLKNSDIAKLFDEWLEDADLTYNKAALKKYNCNTVAIGEDVSESEQDMVSGLANELGLEPTDGE